MAGINPLQLPRWESAQVDFTPLNRLGDALAERARRSRLQEAAAAATGADGRVDLDKLGTRFLAAGEVEPGITATRLAQAAAERAADNARADRSAASLDSYRRAQLDIQRRAFEEGRLPAGFRHGAGGTLEAIPGGPADPEYLRRRGGAGEYGLQPVWGRDADGNPVMMQPGKSGEAIRTKLPEGVTLSGKEPIRMDAGTHIVLMDPLTRQVIGQVPKNIEGKEAAEERGKALGQAQVALPGTLSKAQQSIDLIDAMAAHPGRETATGASRWADPRNYLPGTSARDFAARADQLQGRTFLEAFEGLKGGGAITEVEGRKAEQAIARLDRSQSDGEYLAALQELRGIVAAGMERARARAGQGQAPAAPSAGQPGGGLPALPPGFQLVK